MFKYIYLLAIVVFLGACSFKGTGFLTSYKGLKPLYTDTMHYFYKSPDVNLSQYRKIFIPDIKILALTKDQGPSDYELYNTISAYTTASYKKMLMKKSANYELVGVAQKHTMVMQIALSMVKVNEQTKTLDQLETLPFKVQKKSQDAYSKAEARLMIEVKTTDAMSGKILARSVHVMVDEKVQSRQKIKFSDIQRALDAWLTQTLR